MTELLFATNNAHKLREIRDIFREEDVRVLSLAEAGITHETVEDAPTLEGNARKKAREVAALSGKITFADDTGLMVRALGGAPGVLSNRFSPEGRHADKLLEVMEGMEDREAYFETVIVCVFPSGEEICVSGRAPGRITTEKQGENGFGYDPVFFAVEGGSTFALMAEEEKNRISHRGKAARAFLEEWKKKENQSNDQ